jgi:fructose/tagatose bisphosphate aldolase
VIGELAETQEMLDFYADKGIAAEIEMGPAGGDARGRQHTHHRGAGHTVTCLTKLACIGCRFSGGDTVTIKLVFILD